MYHYVLAGIYVIFKYIFFINIKKSYLYANLTTSTSAGHILY